MAAPPDSNRGSAALLGAGLSRPEVKTSGPVSSRVSFYQPEPVSAEPMDDRPEAASTLLAQEFAPIDLATALRLAGVENPQIQLASQRVVQALAERQLAAAQILPNINLGTNYDNHTGNLQQSNGNILAVNRSALFAGAGANAIAAGSVNIPGLVWNGNLSESLYGYLRSRQLVQERQFAGVATRNEVLLQVAVGYLELLRAEQVRALAVKVRDEAREVARLTRNYAKTGQGRKADADRAATELDRRETDLLMAEAEVLTSSARLAQLLNLDPAVRLHPTEMAMPVAIVPDSTSLRQLIATALMQRPELAERRAAIRRTLLELDSARLLPFSPNVIVGFSAGTFGGGSNLVTPTFGHFDGRTDFDAVAYWSLRNLAVGNRALINAAASRARGSNFELVATLNRVQAEVAEAHARTRARFSQITIGESAVKSGQEAFQEDLIRIKGREGLPIEVLDSLRLLARARTEYLRAVMDYNRAEFELYVALGQPPADVMTRPISPPEPRADPRPVDK
ncbi:MAG: TolC family protein [Planctomycetia bacterium]|nr:TolC family protein [Planctomycetia bacterium]